MINLSLFFMRISLTTNSLNCLVFHHSWPCFQVSALRTGAVDNGGYTPVDRAWFWWLRLDFWMATWMCIPNWQPTVVAGLIQLPDRFFHHVYILLIAPAAHPRTNDMIYSVCWPGFTICYNGNSSWTIVVSTGWWLLIIIVDNHLMLRLMLFFVAGSIRP